jgi:hypothetical protein
MFTIIFTGCYAALAGGAKYHIPNPNQNLNIFSPSRKYRILIVLGVC